MLKKFFEKIIVTIGVIVSFYFLMQGNGVNQVESQFLDFVADYKKSYGTSDEYEYRLGVYQQNLDKIVGLNKANPRATFKINKFGDLTEQEMITKHMGYNGKPKAVNRRTIPRDHKPADFTKMWTTENKDQGMCGSCWAFSATAAFEARLAMKNHKEEIKALFSEQELVDCVRGSSQGCDGGLMTDAFAFLKSTQFCSESEYPYKAVTGECHSERCDDGPNDQGYKEIIGDENALLDELQNGPISVAVDATTWQFYDGGILSDCKKQLNHGVALIGTDGTSFAKIRNSWGADWGEHGNIRLAIDKDTCGYADDASYPLI